MELSPLSVYKKAVSAVPSIKYALGVAGVVAAAIIAYNLSHEDPRRAILGFIFVLAGMYFLLIFASIGKISDIVRGPIIVLVWTLTVLFIACLVLTLMAYAVGRPCGWAQLVGAVCADLRNAGAEATTTTLATSAAQQTTTQSQQLSKAPPASATPAAPPLAEPTRINEQFRISDSSNDCGINQTRTLEYCLAAGARVVDWAGPSIETANCGSSISNIRRVSGRENCIAVDVSVKGCGYDSILGIKNCRGRGWIGGSITINGQAPRG